MGGRSLVQWGINGLLNCHRLIRHASVAASAQHQQWQQLHQHGYAWPSPRLGEQQLLHNATHHHHHHHQQQQQQQSCLLLPTLARSISTSAPAAAAAAAAAAGPAGGAAAGPGQQQQQQQQQPQLVTEMSQKQLGGSQDELDSLLQVLLQPMQREASWNGQLSPYLIEVNDQLMVEPSAALLSVVRALHVIRGVLQEDGHIYVVENNRLLRPLVRTAARSCINPNVWFYHNTWSPGTLTNYASHRRLFKEPHQPNRRLFAAKGLAMVNPLCPQPPAAAAPLPRLSWDDKWLLYNRSRRGGFKILLEQLLEAEDALHRFRPMGSLRGLPRDLRLMVFLDSTKNAVAIKEAFNRNIPTIAVVNTVRDMSHVTYPVLARDFHPNFTHVFLDWIVKVANVAPGTAPELRKQLLEQDSKAASSSSSS